MAQDKRFWLIAGPNGVGKTTYAFRHIVAVSGSVNFVNMDEIARGLSPLAPSAMERKAARTALSMAREFMADHTVFTMETTMAGNVHLELMEEARRAGMSPALLYFSARDPGICLRRIMRRVAEGGHDVPKDVVERRFRRSHGNLERYVRAADLWRIYEASGARPCLAIEGSGGTVDHIDEDCLAGAHEAVRALALSLRA